ncbi:hypothetical protein [Loktanella sp. M215]|uniref:hypothetical protein n=1 Tax=Loktanella sp. M215 TaxID=2675431 RepID=UPI001F1C2B00|nr:hypothetical protein [Loktanella sp. M215]MCF7702222.1 hypothetical protein [Loktanella sp. M215]
MSGHSNGNDGNWDAQDASRGSSQEHMQVAPPFPIPEQIISRQRCPALPSRHALAEIIAAREQVMKPVASPGDAGSKGGYTSASNGEISAETSQRYLHRTAILIKRYRRECSIHHCRLDESDGYLGGLDVHAFAVWLMSLKPGLSAATWRLYRRAAYNVIGGLPHDGTTTALNLLDTDRARHESRAGKDRTGKRSAAPPRKATCFDFDDFNLIQQTILYQIVRSDTPQILRDWMVAGVSVGLRPLEWRATSVEAVTDRATGARMILLFVMNSATTNMSGNGVMRTIDITNLTDAAVGAVQRMSDRGRAWNMRGTFDDAHATVAKLLRTLSRLLFPRRLVHYSLYSCRHQFIANMDTMCSVAEVAALTGCDIGGKPGTPSVALKSVWPEEVIARHPHPIASEVAVVQKIMDLHDERTRFKTRRR